MSTRCNIIVTGRHNGRVYLYHHHDGYPEGVGADLKKASEKWFNRNWFSAYSVANDLIKNKAGLNDDEYELSSVIAGDIDYLYVINCKARTVRCFEVTEWDMALSDIIKRSNLVEIPD